MTILLTGGAGYIGSHIALELLDRGENVVAIDNLSSGFDWALPDGVPLVVGDISDHDLVVSTMRNHGVDEVIHLAGSSVIPDSIADPHAYYGNNSIAAHALLGACLECDVKRFIFSSTAAVYGKVGPEPVKETAPLAPGTPYGRSKMMTEMMLQDIGRASGLAYTALRYFNVAGADPQGRIGQSTQGATHLIKVACEVALGRRKRLQVFGQDFDTPDGTGIRDFIHVSDLANAHFCALKWLRDGGRNMIANCGYGKGYSVQTLVDTLRGMGENLPVEYVEARPGDEACVIADSTVLKRETGWNPQFDNLETTVAHALAWERRLMKRNRIDQI